MRKSYFLMHIAIVLWGFTAILGKLISLDEGLLVWYRMMLSALTMGAFILLKGGFKKLNRHQYLELSGIGILITLHWITFYGAIKASNVSVAISCFSSVALFTAILDPLISRKSPQKGELLLGLAVSTGIYFIFSASELHLKGIILSLISALLASVFTIYNKKISTKYAPEIISFHELGTGFLVLTLLLPVWMKINNSSFSFPNMEDLIYLLILSVFCTTVAFTISLIALKKIDAFTMNLSVNLEPLYSILLAMLLFKEHENLTSGFYIGSTIILSAVSLHGYLTIRRSKKSLIKAKA